MQDIVDKFVENFLLFPTVEPYGGLIPTEDVVIGISGNHCIHLILSKTCVIQELLHYLLVGTRLLCDPYVTHRFSLCIMQQRRLDVNPDRYAVLSSPLPEAYIIFPILDLL